MHRGGDGEVQGCRAKHVLWETSRANDAANLVGVAIIDGYNTFPSRFMPWGDGVAKEESNETPISEELRVGELTGKDGWAVKHLNK